MTTINLVLENDMSGVADLPPGVASHIIAAGGQAFQRQMTELGDITTLASGVLKGAMARNFDELGVTESRATSGVIATPVAGPTTKAV